MLDELNEEEVGKHLVFCLIWNLVEELLVLEVLENIVSSLVPLVLEELFNVPLHVNVYRFIIVVVCHNSKEFVEGIIISIISIELFEFIDDVNELTHDDRKDGHSKEKSKSDV